MASKRSGMLGERPSLNKTSIGIREHRANTISVDRTQIFTQKRRHPSGGNQGSSLLSLGLGYLSPDNKGSSGSIEVGSLEAPVQDHIQDQDNPPGRNEEGLKLTSTLVEIIEVMKTSLNFVNKIVQGMDFISDAI